MTEATPQALLAIIEETEHALSTAAMEARRVDQLATPDDDDLVEAMSALEDSATYIDVLLMRLAAASRGLGPTLIFTGSVASDTDLDPQDSTT